VQCTNPIWLDAYQMRVPCGHCVSCKIAHAREWAVRLVHEMGYHENSCFITLTYDDDHLPADGSISKDELQRFFKRLRKNLDGKKIKYYASGEYGEKNGRPHYHAIVLGLAMGEKTYIEKSWTLGMVHVGTVTYDSCRYVADYIQKKYNSWKASVVYGSKEVPFQISSLGIGKQFALDNREYLSTKLGCTMRGQEVGIPRYYKRMLEIGAEELGALSAEHNKELEDRTLVKVDGDYERVPGALQRSRRQANMNAIARLALHSDRVL